MEIYINGCVLIYRKKKRKKEAHEKSEACSLDMNRKIEEKMYSTLLEIISRLSLCVCGEIFTLFNSDKPLTVLKKSITLYHTVKKYHTKM